MKARLLRAFGGHYAGQIMSNVQEGDYPNGVAEYFEDDDPAIVEVREPGRALTSHAVKADGTVDPLKGSDFEKGQHAKVAAVEKQHVDQIAAQQQAALDKEKSDQAQAEQGAKEAARTQAKVKEANANVPTTAAGQQPNDATQTNTAATPTNVAGQPVSSRSATATDDTDASDKPSSRRK